MTGWTNAFRAPRRLAAAAALSFAVCAGGVPTAAQASDIKVVVNNQAVTSYDIARRKAFLTLQRRKGNLTELATNELIEQALKSYAIQRAGYRIPDSRVDQAFASFANSNKMSSKQLTQVLGQSGVTAKHFKEFIRVQIGWGQLVGAQSRGKGGLMSEQDVVAKMLERGGAKPTSTEYTLQKVIFVVPKSHRKSTLASRRSEANAMRGRVGDCSNTIALAAQLRDVTVQDLGRVLQLELPDRWKDEVSGLQSGQTTRPKDSEDGVEFLIVCRARTVSDDRVAQLQFSTEAVESGDSEAGKKLLEQIRENSRIQRR
ncbi:peptidylprolyl isomerase [Oricola sp.]|uniref:SurA N-terminal domain-containing protein n=1 Tax=Oricola sp. TaxID=1979950 RepID=UPI0025E91C33|nr:peptidylprolyl isomerase [Oricola sp.]MCI5077211.1 peptidylprolyl isomerase [Oricola sp.]